VTCSTPTSGSRFAYYTLVLSLWLTCLFFMLYHFSLFFILLYIIPTYLCSFPFILSSLISLQFRHTLLIYLISLCLSAGYADLPSSAKRNSPYAVVPSFTFVPVSLLIHSFSFPVTHLSLISTIPDVYIQRILMYITASCSTLIVSLLCLLHPLLRVCTVVHCLLIDPL
jgi:hypothetical protein